MHVKRDIFNGGSISKVSSTITNTHTSTYVVFAFNTHNILIYIHSMSYSNLLYYQVLGRTEYYLHHHV